MIRPKKKYCLFQISDRPYQNMCNSNLFYGFLKKNNFFQETHKLRDELLAVVKVTKKRYEKEGVGSKSVQETKNCFRNVQIRHAWK